MAPPSAPPSRRPRAAAPSRVLALPAPAEADAVAAIARAVGAEAAAARWDAARRRAGAAAAPGAPLSPDALERVCAAVASDGDLAAVPARAMALRTACHRHLAGARPAAPGPGDPDGPATAGGPDHADAAAGAAPLAPIPAPTNAEGVRSALADRRRLAEIAALDLIDPETDLVLDDTARRAAAWLGLPVAGVSVVLDEAQHFAALHGADGWLAAARAVPIEWSICRYVVTGGAAVVVDDTTRDPRTRDNPLVYLEGIRSYAGVPLVTARGQVIGTLCVTGPEARHFSPGDLAMLRALAREAVTRIERRRGRRRPGRGRPAPRRA